MLGKTLPNGIPTDPLPSPCTGVCLLESSSGYCQGCLRTLDEIAAWGEASDGYKRAVLLQLAQRTLRPTP